MIGGNPYYHGVLRKLIVVFGKMFSDIKIERKKDGTTQTIKVPIEFAPKEKWLNRLENDPYLENQVQSKLPLMAYIVGSYAYDSMSKTNRMSKIYCHDDNGVKTTYSPVPYSIDFELYIVSKGFEDGAAILEQILPFFTPEYTVKIKAIPELNLIQDVPIILNGVSLEDNYDGDYIQSRFVVHTLNFTLKTKFYGPVRDASRIENITVDFTEEDIENSLVELGITVDSSGNINETWEEN